MPFMQEQYTRRLKPLNTVHVVHVTPDTGFESIRHIWQPSHVQPHLTWGPHSAATVLTRAHS